MISKSNIDLSEVVSKSLTWQKTEQKNVSIVCLTVRDEKSLDYVHAKINYDYLMGYGAYGIMCWSENRSVQEN